MSFPGTAQISILSFRTNSFPPQVPTAVPGPPPFCSILQIARMSIFNTLRLFYYTHFTQEIICKYLPKKRIEFCTNPLKQVNKRTIGSRKN